jgi:DNA-binding transcriptional ArsR family regulator
MEKTILIDRANARVAIDVAKAIEHPIRRGILNLLLASPEGMDVTSIYTDNVWGPEKNAMDQSIASAHLAWLRRANLVKGERKSKQVIYTANWPIIESANMAILALSALPAKDRWKCCN